MKIYVKKTNERELIDVLLNLFQNREDIWEDIKKGIDGYHYRYWEDMTDNDKENLTVNLIYCAMIANVYHNRYTANKVGWNSRVISLSAGSVDYQVNDRNCTPFVLGWDCLSDDDSDDSDTLYGTNTAWVYCSCYTSEEGKELARAKFKPEQIANKDGLPGHLEDYYRELESSGTIARQW